MVLRVVLALVVGECVASLTAYRYQRGGVATYNDIDKQTMTVPDAQSHCDSLPACVAFYFSDAAATPPGPVEMHFTTLSFGVTDPTSHAYFKRDLSSLQMDAAFGDHMVLQRAPLGASVWGTAPPNSKVMVQIDSVAQSAVSDANGEWKVLLAPHAAGGPFALTAYAQAVGNVTLNDVMFGDVWICSGQSNMELGLSATLEWPQVKQDVMDGKYTNLRPFKVMDQWTFDPKSRFYGKSDVALDWVQPNSNTADILQGFSATCWFFARHLYDSMTTKVALGLIEASVGGTLVEAWTTPKVLQQCSMVCCRDFSVCNNSAALSPDDHPSSLFNAMISPVLSTSITGVVWYQGESNIYNQGDRAAKSGYQCLFPAMIADWEQSFVAAGASVAPIPFGFVSLAGYCNDCTNHPPSNDHHVAEMRLTQMAGYRSVPNPAQPHSFMAIAYDLEDVHGDDSWWDIHPRYKDELGRRLSLGALAGPPYKQTGFLTTGPVLMGCQVEGQNVILQFDPTLLQADKMLAQNSNGLEALALGQWVPLTLTTAYPSASSIVATLPSAVPITQLRYAWRDNPCCPSAYTDVAVNYTCTMISCALYASPSMLPAVPFLANIDASGSCLKAEAYAPRPERAAAALHAKSLRALHSGFPNPDTRP